MESIQQNIPNTGRRTIKAHLRVKSFVSSKSPDEAALKKYDKEIVTFLETIDNEKRFLNGRNSYALGDRIYTIVWYLERLPDKPVSTPFGKKDAKVDSPKEKKPK